MKKTNNKNNLYIAMEDMVKKAITIIQGEAAVFSQNVKTSYAGVDDDLVTSADIKAQAMFVEAIQQQFPNDGLIGEENGLNIEAKPGHGYFTIDPLDGTKAFGRTQSTGSATMIAHVDENNIVDAICIGDINTGEIYGFGPGHEPSRTRFGVKSVMKVDTDTPLKKRYIILRDNPINFPPVLQKIFNEMFKDMEITSGSIGLNVARLWKNEVGMVIIKPGFNTPWDNTPIAGMNKVLGIIHLQLDNKTSEIKVFEQKLFKEVDERPCVEMYVHKGYLPEIMRWIELNK